MPADDALARLLAAHVPGRALDGAFYAEPRLFDVDMERMLLRHWFCAGHASSLPQAGDYLVAELGSESVILVRDPQGSINALVNVCRHRGSRICTRREGKTAGPFLICPYHAWTYDLGGRLIAASQMAKPFERNEFGLKSLPVRVVEGLIFTTFAAQPLDFAPAAAALAACAGIHGWSTAKVAHRELYSIDANWKLALENYMECYHCQPAHPEYAKRHALSRPAVESEPLDRIARQRSEALGIFIPDIDQYGQAAAPGGESVSVFRSALHIPAGTSPESHASAPLMGGFKGYDGNSTYFDIGPLSDFLAYADHGIVYRFIPRSATHTQMEVIWLVDAAARDGVDYDVGRLTALWKTTSLEDKRIVECNQAGVRSRFFEPGPYSLQESYANRFVEWYLDELRHAGRRSQ